MLDRRTRALSYVKATDEANRHLAAARAQPIQWQLWPGDRDKARKYSAKLIVLYEQAERDRPELLQAKVYLA
jgi:hypothetical protein